MGTYKPGGSRAVFLDRDGVINRNVLNPATGRYEAPLVPEDFEFIAGACEAMRELKAAGFLLFLVSNQPNCALGKSSLETLTSIHEKLLGGLALQSIEFARFYYCLHHPHGNVAAYSYSCECRKPSPYFLLKAQAEFEIDLGRSWMVGDRLTDIECGKAAGTRTILITAHQSGWKGTIQPDEIASDLSAATRLIVDA